MSDYSDTNLVVQANELVRNTNWSMNTVPLKLFKGIVSCIDTKQPPEDNKITIKKTELLALVGEGENTSNYTFLRQQMESLMKQVIYLKKENKLIQIPLVSKVVWNLNGSDVVCHFDEDIMPYLIKMQGMFLQYPVTNLIGFNSKYGLILYENLLSRIRQYRKDVFVLTVEELRHVTGTEKKYSKMVDFQSRVLKAAITDINEAGVEYLVKYETVKKGRSISEIKFTVRPRTSCLEKSYEDIRKPSLLQQNLRILQNPFKDKKQNNEDSSDLTKKSEILYSIDSSVFDDYSDTVDFEDIF